MNNQRYKLQDLADGTGLSKGMISRVLHSRDISNLTYESAKAIANWLGVPMEELGEEAEE